jgi:hypothetical protein
MKQFVLTLVVCVCVVAFLIGAACLPIAYPY